jgi:arylformamidase
VSRYVELNHELTDGMAVFPGLPSPRVTAILDHAHSRDRYAGQAEFYLGNVELAGDTATYLDSPFHRYPNGRDLSEIPLADVAGLPGIHLEAVTSEDRSISFDAEEEALAGHAVLVRSGWDERWGTDAYWQPGPYLSPAALELLLRARPKLVGVDCWNVDDIDDPARPAHTRLLTEGILIVENLCKLDRLPATGFRFSAIPLRIAGGASFPVRAFAEMQPAE